MIDELNEMLVSVEPDPAAEEISLWEFYSKKYNPVSYMYIFGVVIGGVFHCTGSFSFTTATLPPCTFPTDYFVGQKFYRTDEGRKKLDWESKFLFGAYTNSLGDSWHIGA